MSTLLELSSIAKSIDLKDMMVVLFEIENGKDLITANNMNIIAEYLATHVRESDLLIGELDNCLGSTTTYESSKLLREKNDADLAKARCLEQLVLAAKGDMKFRDRVFPHRVGLTITSLDLLGVIEDEEYFSKLCDADAIRVCLLLCLEDEIMNVVSNHKSEYLEGLHKSPKYVPTYTLSGFVWAFKEQSWWNKVAEAIPRGIRWSKKVVFIRSDYRTLFCKDSSPIFDLIPTLAEGINLNGGQVPMIFCK
ncbi:hypothetical protein Tco_0998682, partial [Tanacetum coccineum]